MLAGVSGNTDLLIFIMWFSLCFCGAFCPPHSPDLPNGGVRSERNLCCAGLCVLLQKGWPWVRAGNSDLAVNLTSQTQEPQGTRPWSRRSISLLKVFASNSLSQVMCPTNVLQKAESMRQMQNKPGGQLPGQPGCPGSICTTPSRNAWVGAMFISPARTCSLP